jgi:hypothetical protein
MLSKDLPQDPPEAAHTSHDDPHVANAH